jgi:hypothetical protein
MVAALLRALINHGYQLALGIVDCKPSLGLLFQTHPDGFGRQYRKRSGQRHRGARFLENPRLVNLHSRTIGRGQFAGANANGFLRRSKKGFIPGNGFLVAISIRVSFMTAQHKPPETRP